MARSEIIIVQHTDWEAPGAHLKKALGLRGAPFQVWRAWEEPPPRLERFAAIIVLGGPPNADEEEKFPYLLEIQAAIREVLESKRAYLGFCLGHQLLARALGCRVGPLPRKSVGFATVRLTNEGEAHPAFRRLPKSFPAFKWHGQGVLPPVPDAVEILAESPEVPVEAIGLRGEPRIVGLQFDNHAGAEDAARWLAEDREWASSGTNLVPEDFLARAAAEERSIEAWFLAFMENFLRAAGIS